MRHMNLYKNTVLSKSGLKLYNPILYVFMFLAVCTQANADYNQYCTIIGGGIPYCGASPQVACEGGIFAWGYNSGADFGETLSVDIARKKCVVHADGYIEEHDYIINVMPGDPKNLGTPRCNASASNPINVTTGNKVQVEVDIIHDGGRLVYSRIYNGQTAFSSSLGSNWRPNFSQAITLDETFSPPVAKAIRENGQVISFRKSGGIWNPDSDIKEVLEEIPDTSGNRIGWKYKRSDNLVESYDVSGKLTNIVYPSGYTQSLTYDSISRLAKINTSTGKYLLFGYDSMHRVSTVSDDTGRVLTYRYDTNNNLEFVDYPDATTKQYHYNEPVYTSGANLTNALTGITDERGIRYAIFEYLSDGRVSASYHAGSVIRVDVSYDDSNNVRTLTNSLGQQSTYSIATQINSELVTGISGVGCATCGASDSIYSYDPVTNNLLSETKDGITRIYGNYNSNGDPGFLIEASATPEERRFDYTYDTRFYGKVATRIEPSVRGNSSRVVSYTYDDFGNLIGETISGFTPDGNPVSRSVTWQYGGDGTPECDAVPLRQLCRYDGPRTDVSDITTFEYYPNDPSEGNNRSRLKRVTGPNGIIQRDAIQYTATGKVQSEERPNGLSLSFTYTAGRDWMETLTQSAAGQSTTTRWTYLPTGEVESVTIADGTPEATTLTFTYDGARRLTRVADGLGNYIEYTLDTEGNKLAENIYDISNVLKKALTQTFDVYNRLDISSQLNETIDFDYAPDGTLDLLTDGNNIVTDYSYDALKRLTRTTRDLNGSDPATADAFTQYGYDTSDRLTSVTDPNGNVTSYIYDDLGNLLSQTSPDTGTTTYSYDAAGNLKTRQDANGNTFTYTYDALNRLIFLDAPGTADDVSYNYDACTNGIGRLCSITRGTSTVDYSYDAFGNITAHQGIAYTYDNAQRMKTITYPSGAVVTYTYDASGRISQADLTRDGQTTTLAGNITYAPFGPATSLNYGNGLSMNTPLDTTYRTQSIDMGAALSLEGYQYDGNGNIIQRSRDTQPESYGYDALNRLDIATGGFGSRDYDYDKNGNRTQLIADAAIMGYGYEPASNRLNLFGTLSVQLDANGNTLAQGSRSFTYDAHNRLKTASDNGATSGSYAYNGLGQRSSKTVNGTLTQYRYGLDGTLLAETDDQGQVLKEYFTLNGQPLAVLAATAASPTTGIQLDGQLNDWTSADQLDAPPWYAPTQGVTLYSRIENGTVYIALQSDSQAIAPSTTFWLDTDLNPQTGHPVWGFAVGAEYNINIYTDGTPHLYTGADGQNWQSGPLNHAYNATNTVLEVAIPQSALGQSSAFDLYMDLNNSIFWPADYTTPGYRVPPRPDNGNPQLDGQASDWSDADLLGTHPDGYKLYGRYLNGLVFLALESTQGQAIGPSTTLWLNTDQDTTTGYQVWGFATGAEYNINVYTDGTPHLYTGADGQNWQSGPLVHAYNATNTFLELAVPKNALGGLNQALDLMADINNTSFMPTDYTMPGYTLNASQPPPAGTPPSVTSTLALYYIHNDHLGTPQVLTDENGQVVWRAVYNPFGSATVNEDVDGDGNRVTFNKRFPGQYYDQETGLHYNYFRYYDPQTGRYITSDPIGLAGGLNTYAYVLNNPLSYIDPYGLWAIGDPLPQGLVDATAGFGDALSFGFTDWVRDQMGTNDAVDKCSGAYTGGTYAGYGWGAGLAGAGLYRGYQLGWELSLGRNFRIAPFGNRTGHPTGRFPHYHRRGVDPATGQTRPGQGIGRHRPWDTRSTDRSFGDRF